MQSLFYLSIVFTCFFGLFALKYFEQRTLARFLWLFFRGIDGCEGRQPEFDMFDANVSLRMRCWLLLTILGLLSITATALAKYH
jgi:hypothetical protein